MLVIENPWISQSYSYLKLTWRWYILSFPTDIGIELDVHKTFRRRAGRLLNVLCTFNLRPVSTGFAFWKWAKKLMILLKKFDIKIGKKILNQEIVIIFAFNLKTKNQSNLFFAPQMQLIRISIRLSKSCRTRPFF